MTDIGILTFHNNENYGAVLQAYGVYRLLEKEFEGNVEIVEYKTRAKEIMRLRRALITKRPRTIPSRLRDRRTTEKFFETELSTSENSIVTDNHDKAVSWLQEQNYDVLVTGSDEVWKIRQENKSIGLFPELSSCRPFPNLYFLDQSVSGIKFSYAASANTTDPEALSEETLQTFKRHMNSYDHISIRDRYTEHLLEDLGIIDVTQVPDPTLMIDIPTRDVRSILQNCGLELDKPVLGFHGPDVPVFKRICERYRDRGYQIVTTTSSRFADVELSGVVDPYEYYSVYQHFDMVVTNSLHSSIFSIKHGTPFATIDTSSVYENIESKTYSLLHDFSMLDRHIDAVDGDASEFYENRDALETKPDKTHSENRIDELQERGLEFLDGIKIK